MIIFVLKIILYFLGEVSRMKTLKILLYTNDYGILEDIVRKIIINYYYFNIEIEKIISEMRTMYVRFILSLESGKIVLFIDVPKIFFIGL